jgi:hypothetical protein
MSTTLTKTEWQQVEQRLQSEYSPVALLCDGYHLCLHLKRINMRLVIAFFVNGEFQAKWMSEEYEEGRRFMRPVKKSVWSAKSLATIKKMSKAQLKRMKVDPKEAYTIFYPWWTNVQDLRRHLEKHNQSIELLKEWQYKGPEPATNEEERV